MSFELVGRASRLTGKTFLDITLKTGGGEHLQQIIDSLSMDDYTVQVS